LIASQPSRTRGGWAFQYHALVPQINALLSMRTQPSAHRGGQNRRAEKEPAAICAMRARSELRPAGNPARSVTSMDGLGPARSPLTLCGRGRPLRLRSRRRQNANETAHRPDAQRDHVQRNAVAAGQPVMAYAIPASLRGDGAQEHACDDPGTPNTPFPAVGQQDHDAKLNSANDRQQHHRPYPFCQARSVRSR
jgi:hypothetical protein